MMRYLCILFVFTCFIFHAQDEDICLNTATGKIYGTLRFPEKKSNLDLVILHAGSGPTDRNGNQEEIECNTLRYLADVLASEGFASLRYDKRGVGESKSALTDEWEITLDKYVNDLRDWILMMSKEKRFKKIIVCGHSEGALIGMLASENNSRVKAFISLAGSGKPADELIKEQMSNAPEDIRKSLFGMLDRIKKGDTIEKVPPVFYPLIRPGVQPYLRSWFKYDPAIEIAKLNIPVLILQGNTDIQVKEKDAELLKLAKKDAKLLIIPNMNHTLKECRVTDKTSQIPFYTDPSFPLHAGLTSSLTEFLHLVR